MKYMNITRFIRRKDSLILGNKDYLYWTMIAGTILILLGIHAWYNGYSSWKTIVLGSILIIVALMTPVKNIIIDYNKKELRIARESILPIVREIEIHSIKDIKKIYSESNKMFMLTQQTVILLEKNDKTTILLKSDRGGEVSKNYDYFGYIAKVLDDKIQELKK